MSSSHPVFKWEALRTSQVALNAVTETLVFAKETLMGGNQSMDDIRIVRNMDAAIVIYLGPIGVTALTGFPLGPNESFILSGPSGMGIKSAVYAIAASGTPKAAVLAQ